MIKCINPKAVNRPNCWLTNQHCVHDCKVDHGYLLWFKKDLQPGRKDYVFSLCGKAISETDRRSTIYHPSENLIARFHFDCFLTAWEDGKI
jgi:hypothetical protein